MIKKLLFGVIALLAAYYLGNCCLKNETEIPKMPEPNWGLVDGTKDSSVRPFKISVPKDVINDLKERLSRTREPVPPLENVGWTYGLSSKYFKKIIDYWVNKYDWYKRQDLLNKYPQFITNIQGIDIHFYHVKPSKSLSTDGKPLKVLPLLLVHGWPGSVVEFQKIIPMLTTPRPGRDFVFEVIAPSLPGYGFSQAAVRPHMGHAQMAVVMKNLMTRLGFDKFYTQGGDWGSLITTDISTLFPDRVTGAHLNMCGVRNSKSFFWLLVGSYFPSLVVESEHYSKVYPLTEKWSRLLEESGYFHLQATKPDTIGTALMQAPAALATYILEKFSTWTNPEYRFRDDGGLLEKFSMDELLDNVMVYWITDSITTSMRLYAESFSSENNNKYDSLTTSVPVACANFPHELTYTPKSLIEMRFKNLIQFNHLPRGGHFAAFEEPKLLADDFWTFVEKVEQKFTK